MKRTIILVFFIAIHYSNYSQSMNYPSSWEESLLMLNDQLSELKFNSRSDQDYYGKKSTYIYNDTWSISADKIVKRSLTSTVGSNSKKTSTRNGNLKNLIKAEYSSKLNGIRLTFKKGSVKEKPFSMSYNGKDRIMFINLCSNSEFHVGSMKKKCNKSQYNQNDEFVQSLLGKLNHIAKLATRFSN